MRLLAFQGSNSCNGNLPYTPPPGPPFGFTGILPESERVEETSCERILPHCEPSSQLVLGSVGSLCSSDWAGIYQECHLIISSITNWTYMDAREFILGISFYCVGCSSFVGSLCMRMIKLGQRYWKAELGNRRGGDTASTSTKWVLVAPKSTEYDVRNDHSTCSHRKSSFTTSFPGDAFQFSYLSKGPSSYNFQGCRRLQLSEQHDSSFRLVVITFLHCRKKKCGMEQLSICLCKLNVAQQQCVF